MKRIIAAVTSAALLLSVALLCAAWRRPITFRLGKQFLFDLTKTSMPEGMVATRTGGTLYLQTGTSTVKQSTAPDVPEDFGNGMGIGHWTFDTYTNEVTTPFTFTGGSWVQLFHWSTGSGATGPAQSTFQTAGGLGPDGATTATIVYDIASDESPGLQWTGTITYPTLWTGRTSLWIKTTGNPQATFTDSITGQSSDANWVPVGSAPAAGYEFGKKFTVDVSGKITAVSYLRMNTEPAATHTFHLWNADTTTLLQTISTTSETSAGWQVVQVNPPWSLVAGTNYVLSQAMENGHVIMEKNIGTTYPLTTDHVTQVCSALTTTAQNLFPPCFATRDPPVDATFEDGSTVVADGVYPPVVASDGIGAPTPATAVWQRVQQTSQTFPVGGATSQITFYPTGGTSSGNPPVSSFDQGQAVGGLQVWGAQVTGTQDEIRPLINGTTTAATLSVTDSSYLNTVVDENGDIHLLGDFLVDTQGGWTPNTDYATLFDMDTVDGKYTLTAGQQTVVNYKQRGVATTCSTNVGNFPTGSVFRWEFFYMPSQNLSGDNFWINGMLNVANANACRIGAAGISHNPTAVALGSSTAGANISARRQSFLARADLVGRSDPNTVEFIILGDSITSDYPGDHNAIGKYVYTFKEAQTRQGIGSFSTPGETTAQQQTRWDTSKQKGQTYVRAVMDATGINNLATAITDRQALITDVNTSNPSAQYYLWPLTPARAALTAPNYANWLAVNQAVAGGGATPITGSNLIRMGPWIGTNDGNDNLASWANSGDNLHELNPAAIYYAKVWRAYLQANNRLNGGTIPTCTGFSPSHGAIGSNVTVTGTGLIPINAGSVNGVALTSLVPSHTGTDAIDDVTATIVVPPGASTGSIVIGTPLGNATCPGTFTVP